MIDDGGSVTILPSPLHGVKPFVSCGERFHKHRRGTGKLLRSLPRLRFHVKNNARESSERKAQEHKEKFERLNAAVGNFSFFFIDTHVHILCTYIKKFERLIER